MDMRITSGGAQTGSVDQWQQRQQSYKDLGSALQSGDLDAAKTAYASMTAGSSYAANHPDSPVARLGKALDSGHIEWAQQAYSRLHTGHRHETTAPGSGGTVQPSPPTATTGNNLNVVA